MSDTVWVPVTLCQLASEGEAHLVVGMLEAAGVPARAVGGFIAGFRAEIPATVAVLVDEGDLATARRLLAEHHKQAGNIDWSRIDVGEPLE